jgi:protein TonB
MQYLIASGPTAITDTAPFRIVEFVMVAPVETPPDTRRKPPKPPEPEQPPPDRPPPEVDPVDAGVPVGPVSPGPISTRPGRERLGDRFSDGEYLPIVKVVPTYPRRAITRGLEGYVVVAFTVTRAGTVKDATVAESSNSIFDQAAVAAALKFRYKPRVIDGEPVEVPGVRNRITFQLQN